MPTTHRPAAPATGTICLAAIIAFAACAPCAHADELDDLIASLKPTPRFQAHAPAFSVEPVEHVFNHVRGPVKTTFQLVRDGPRNVALITDGGIHMLSFWPSDPPAPLVLPTGRWHIDTYLGAIISTGAFIPGQSTRNNDNYTQTLQGSGTDRLILTRRFNGTRSAQRTIREGGRSSRQTIHEQLEVHNQFTLRCDPVLGYLVEAVYNVATSHPPDEYQFTNLMAQGTYDLWPGQARTLRTVITRQGHSGYLGYAHNLQAFDLSDNDRPIIRDGGFGAYLNNQTHYSPCITLRGAPARMVICNAHADIDFMVQWPADSKPDDNGLHRLSIHHRLLCLAPEITEHLWKHMELRFQDRQTVTIRIGEPEDFEDQPVAATSTRRGIINTTGMTLSTEQARSGKQSLLVRSTLWPNLPQIALLPNAHYRVEAWVRLVLFTPEEKQAQQQADQRRREALAKQSKPLPPEETDPRPRAWISAHLYEWTPHANKWEREQNTNVVTAQAAPADSPTPTDSANAANSADLPPDGQWQRIRLDFSTPAWDPFVDIRFHARNATAYFDDFQLIQISPAKAPSAPCATQPSATASP